MFMNCVEFERILLEDGRIPEQQAHLDSCSVCASLLADLDFISSQAKSLVAVNEPSPAVWNAIEAQLRREGLIRAPQISEPRISEPRIDFFRRWRAAWLVPVAAALALIAVARLHRPAGAGDNVPIVKQTVAQVPNASVAASVSGEDRLLLDTVAARPPALRAKYTAELEDANAFIRDAEAAVKLDPNDIYRQQMLINAYEQKQMLYDLAVDNMSEQ
jgi:hypothetical protein